MFRFNHPKEAAKLREKRKVSSVESRGAKSTLRGGGARGGGRGVSALAPEIRLSGAGTSPQGGLPRGRWAGGVG